MLRRRFHCLRILSIRQRKTQDSSHQISTPTYLSISVNSLIFSIFQGYLLSQTSYLTFSSFLSSTNPTKFPNSGYGTFSPRNLTKNSDSSLKINHSILSMNPFLPNTLPKTLLRGVLSFYIMQLGQQKHKLMVLQRKIHCLQMRTFLLIFWKLVWICSKIQF